MGSIDTSISAHGSRYWVGHSPGCPSRSHLALVHFSLLSTFLFLTSFFVHRDVPSSLHPILLYHIHHQQFKEVGEATKNAAVATRHRPSIVNHWFCLFWGRAGDANQKRYARLFLSQASTTPTPLVFLTTFLKKINSSSNFWKEASRLSFANLLGCGSIFVWTSRTAERHQSTIETNGREDTCILSIRISAPRNAIAGTGGATATVWTTESR